MYTTAVQERDGAYTSSAWPCARVVRVVEQLRELDEDREVLPLHTNHPRRADPWTQKIALKSTCGLSP